MKNLFLYLCVVAVSLNEVTASSCDSSGETLYANSLLKRSLSAPNVQGSHTCVWRIRSHLSSYAVELTFDYLTVGSTSICSSSYIAIHDGFSSSSVQLGKACGTKRPPIIRSRSNYLYLKLVSTGQTSFKLTFKAVKLVTSTTKCTSSNSFYNNNNLRFSASTGYIRSPNYPLNYPSGMQCTWIITVPSGKKAELHFDSYINLEGGFCSSNDYVQVRDGSSASRSLGIFCSGKPSTIKASGRTIWVRFRSDEDSRNNKGFEARYTTQTSYSSGSSSSSSNAGVIVGVIFGVAVLIVVIVVISYCAKRGNRGAIVARRAPATTVALTTTNQSVAAPAPKQPGYYPPPAQQPGHYPPQAQQPQYYPPPAQQPGYYPPPAQQPGPYPPPVQQPGPYPHPVQQPGQVPGAYPMGPVGAHPPVQAGPQATGAAGQYPAPGQPAGYPPGPYPTAPPDAEIGAPPPPYPGY